MNTITFVLSAIVVVYLLAIMPRMIHRADDSVFKGWYLAHRGLFDNKTNAPENSIPAFENAIRNN